MRATKLLFLLITCILAGSGGFCQNNPSSLLWEISGNGIMNTSYIYGTIHIVDKENFKISDSLKKMLNASKTLALEIDMNMSLGEKIALAKQTFLPDGKTIKDYMSAEEFAKFKKMCVDSLKIKEKKFNKYIRIKPFFLSGILMKEQMKKTESYEITLNKMAKKKGLNITGLESIQYQLDVINTISIDEQIKMTLQDMSGSSDNSDMDKLFSAYNSQNIDSIYSYTAKETEEIPGFLENFIYKRNSNWIPVIEGLIAKQKTFIAVGAAHLGGEKGIVELLRKQGYTLKPIIQH